MTTISTQAEVLFSAALKLPYAERAEIAERLLESLASEELRWEDADPEWRAAWEVEIRRRIADVKSGKTQLLDGETVMRELRERLAK